MTYSGCLQKASAALKFHPLPGMTFIKALFKKIIFFFQKGQGWKQPLEEFGGWDGGLVNLGV